MPRSGVKNARRLGRKFRQMPKEITDEVKKVVQQEAKFVLDEMFNSAPRTFGAPKTLGLHTRSGNRRFTAPRRHLVDDLKVRSRKGGMAAVIGILGKTESEKQNAVIAIWANFGTRRFPATHFMDIAVKSREGIAVRRIGDAVEVALEKVARLPLGD